MRRRLTVREVIKLIENDGWFRVRTKGSHRQFKHPVKRGKVTVSGHPKDTVPPRTLGHILKQAQLEGK